MAFPANEIVEVKIGYLVNDQQCWNVLHYLADDTFPGPSPFDIQTALLDHLDNQIGTAGTLINTMRLMWGLNVSLNYITVQGVFPTRYRMVKGEYTSPGLDAGTCEAQNVAAYIEKVGEEANRHNIGSLHLGGLSAAAYAAGELQAGYFGNLQTIAERMKDPISFTSGGVDYDYTPVILNKTPVEVDGKVKYLISGSTVLFDTVPYETLRTQRTRTKGYGE